jgi:hypothetical protein
VKTKREERRILRISRRSCTLRGERVAMWNRGRRKERGHFFD